jgi:hypothetical protein
MGRKVKDMNKEDLGELDAPLSPLNIDNADGIAFRKLWTHFFLQMMEDALIKKELCELKTSKGAQYRHYKAEARNFFFSASPETTSWRRTIFAQGLGFDNVEKCLNVCRGIIATNNVEKWRKLRGKVILK